MSRSRPVARAGTGTRRSRAAPSPPAELESLPSQNLAQLAYARLRGAIEDGTLAPGQRLMETQVSAWLRISRTPAREALRRLEAEGLLEYGPSGGLSVTLYDAVAVKELYAVRESLEGAAAAMAARNADPYEIEMLRAHVRAQASLPPDIRVHAGENKLFHESLYRAAHNRFLMKSVQALQDAMTLLGQKNFAVPNRMQSSIEEHRAIVEAIAARDPTQAEEAARRHIRHGYDSRVKAMAEELHTAALERSRGGTAPPTAARGSRRR